MLNIPEYLARELSLRPDQVQNALALFADGATVPFVARYRKERTGGLNETQLHDLADRSAYLTELEERKKTVLESIQGQGKLTEELRARIEDATQKRALEDLYLPFKPKRRTRATVAREKGLEGLAACIMERNTPECEGTDLDAEANRYVSAERGVASVDDALAGASDILAEHVAEQADLRSAVRHYLLEEGTFVSTVRDSHAPGTTKYEMYRNFSARAKEIAPHNILALNRGEAEHVVTFSLHFDRDHIIALLESSVIRTVEPLVRSFLQAMIADAFDRLLKPALIADIRQEKKHAADLESIRTFEANLRELLLASPAGLKPTLGVDPGFRTGCKVAAVGPTGMFLGSETIFPHSGEGQRARAVTTLKELIQHHEVALIAVGNGTAGRETEAFVREVITSLDPKPVCVMVNEAGASVYSASRAAIEEFPDLDVTVRGAISIARRLQDPLSELVKIDPKSIGVGQYQHDVDQKLLRKKLDETVESAVNYVGVDLNTASRQLLSYVSGLTASAARNIVAYRDEHGPFRNRNTLREVPMFGTKAFEQAAGFLRIRDGEVPLDNTAVHPESYWVVEKMAGDLGMPARTMTQAGNQLGRLDLRRYVTGDVGEPTLRDILEELRKPGRDPRAEFRYASFTEGVTEIKDLKPGMMLEGIVTNVADFGAFVDIGVHQDGLVHVSQLADRFIRDPRTVVKVGQIVRVRVLEVNEQLKRISLSLKAGAPRGKTASKPRKKTQSFTLNDLKKKFNSR
jgi:uncharacterized protein